MANIDKRSDELVSPVQYLSRRSTIGSNRQHEAALESEYRAGGNALRNLVRVSLMRFSSPTSL